jgi:hypothetical protein
MDGQGHVLTPIKIATRMPITDPFGAELTLSVQSRNANLCHAAHFTKVLWGKFSKWHAIALYSLQSIHCT